MYTITHDLTNLTQGDMTFVIEPDSTYTLPQSSSDITVTNGTLVSYDSSTGSIVVRGDDTTTVSVLCRPTAATQIL